MESLPDSSTSLRTVEMHTCGEPLRIVVGGMPEIRGSTILEKYTYAKEKLDHIRRMLMAEPRGHNDMFGGILVKPDLEEADIAVLFTYGTGFATMCGHGVIALARFAVDHGYVKDPKSPETVVNIQCPCGLVKAYVEYDENTKVTGRARFHSVPAFAVACDISVDVPGYGKGSNPSDPTSMGKVKLDVSYGGAYYAIVDAAEVGLDILKTPIEEIRTATVAVKAAIIKSVPITHPQSPELSFLFGLSWTDGKDTYSPDEPTANIIIVGDTNQVDRAPCGSGVTARLAAQYRKGLIPLAKHRTFRQPRVVNSAFSGAVVEERECFGRQAIIADVRGKAYYTGECTFSMPEPDDEIGRGFVMR